MKSTEKGQKIGTQLEIKRMLSLRRRLRILKQSPFFQDFAGPVNAIVRLALRQISDEHLELMIIMARAKEAGLGQTLSPGERAALVAYHAALNETSGGQRT